MKKMVERMVIARSGASRRGEYRDTVRGRSGAVAAR